MITPKNQNEAILAHLRAYEAGLTSREAALRLGVMDLPKRISELRKDHNIRDAWVKRLNSYHNPVRYKVYWLEE